MLDPMFVPVKDHFPKEEGETLMADSTGIVREVRLGLVERHSPVRRNLSIDIIDGPECEADEREVEFENSMSTNTVQGCSEHSYGETKRFNSATFGSGGVTVRTPFFPAKIRVRSYSGAITVLPHSSNSRGENCEAMVRRNIPITKTERASTRKIIPGRNIALRLVANHLFVRADQGGSLFADRSMARLHEIFAVVSLPGLENCFVLKSLWHGRYLSCKGKGEPLFATCDAEKVGLSECFLEEDAGDDRISLRSAQSGLYVGGQRLHLVDSEVSQSEKFEEFEVTQVEYVF